MKCEYLRGAPLRNRTVDLLLTIDSQNAPEVTAEPLSSQNANSPAAPVGPGERPRAAVCPPNCPREEDLAHEFEVCPRHVRDVARPPEPGPCDYSSTPTSPPNILTAPEPESGHRQLRPEEQPCEGPGSGPEIVRTWAMIHDAFIGRPVPVAVEPPATRGWISEASCCCLRSNRASPIARHRWAHRRCRSSIRLPGYHYGNGSRSRSQPGKTASGDPEPSWRPDGIERTDYPLSGASGDR